MATSGKDPIGAAIQQYAETSISKDIIVHSDICDDDIIPSHYLFRTYDEMPEMEQFAIEQCDGTILDVGAGTGCHARILDARGYNVCAIDISEGAVKHMQDTGLYASNERFEEVTGKFDTILMLMNGIGLAGSLNNLERTLQHAKSLLNKNGKIICDSDDIKYLYEAEDGSYWIDLNAEYYGNFQFQMEFEGQKTDWFPWLYVDEDNFAETAAKVGLKFKVIFREDNRYLAELTIKE
jgi:SAM-dependent methyltransferase